MSDTGNPTIVASGVGVSHDLMTAAEKLIESVTLDERDSGGLLSRETIHKADALRVLLSRWRNARRRQ